MTIAIAQPTGVGSAVGELGLSGAWLDEPVVVTLPAAQYIYETTILDFSTGCTVTLGGAATAAPTITPTGGKGSVRFMARYRATSVSRWVTYYRVVRFQRDADGTNLETVAPALNEAPAETAETRGYATIMDQVVADTSTAAVVAGSLPTGAAQTLPDSDSTLTSARRALQATLTTPLVLTTLAVRTQTVPNGTTVGERRTLRRSNTTSLMRLRFVNADGSHIAWASGPINPEAEWDGTGWRLLGGDRKAKVFYPEDFGNDVGVGNAAADTAAIQAIAAAIYNADASGQASGEQSCEVVFSAPEYCINAPILFRGTDYTSVRLRGIVPGEYGGFKGNRLQWEGPIAAKMTGTPTMTFNRAARTIVRSTGSWISDGFTTGMMRVYCGRPDNQNTGDNVRMFDEVTVTNATTLTVTDTGIAAMMPFDEVAASGYQIVEALAVVRFLSSGFTVQDLTMFAQELTGAFWAGYHVDIAPHLTNLTNTTDFKFDGVAVLGAIDHPLACLWAVGRPPSNPAVGSQCDTGRWNRVFGVGSRSYNTSHQANGVCFLDGSNTKDFWITNSMFWSVRRAIDHEKASETIHVSNCRFDDVGECALYNNGFAHVSDCQAERIAASVLGSQGNLVETNNSWNCRAPASNVVLAQRQVTAHGTQYINDRVYMTVTAVNAGTDTWTGTNNNEALRPPTNGDEVVLRSASGDHGLPVGVSPDATHWIANVAETGAGTNIFTFTLYRGGPSGGGGTLVDAISYPGTFYVMSPSVIALNDQNKTSTSTDQSGASFDGCRFWGAEKFPHVRGSAAWAYTFDATQSIQAAAQTRVHVRNCYGIRPGPTYIALREISSVPVGFLGCAPHPPELLGFKEDVVILGQGLNTSGWTTFEYDWRRLKDGSGYAATGTLPHIFLPLRCGILDVRSEVVPDGNGAIGFAGAGPLTAMTLQVGIYSYFTATTPDPDNLLTAHNVFAGSFTTESNKRWGFKNSEKGVDLQFGNQWWTKDTGATDYGWVGGWTGIQVLFTPTGGTMAQLTAGRVRLHIKTEQIPHWERT